MPVITIALQPVSTETKKSLIASLTRSAAEATRIPEDKFIVLVDELGEDAIGLGGRSLREVMASRPA